MKNGGFTTRKHVIFIILLSLLLFSISIPNVFAFVQKKSIGDLTRDSDDIITGKVLSKESHWENGNIFTDVIISADRHIKGNSDNKFTTKVRGGTVGNVYAEVSDVPLFDNNEEVLLFLKNNNVVGWNQGKYSIQNNSIRETGESLEKFVNNIEQNIQKQVGNKNIVAGGHTGIYSTVIGTNLDTNSMTKVHQDNSISNGLPHITNVTPSFGPSRAMELGSDVAADNSTQVTISGSAFGTTRGGVKFWCVGTVQYDATIVSWTNTKIVANIPGRISSGTKPGGDGNVQVFASDGTPSDNYGIFDVTYSYGGGKSAGNKITYLVNPDNIGAVNVIPAIQAATDTWSNVSNFKFVYGGQSSKTDVAMDGENSIIWVNYDIGSVATTTTWWVGTDTKTIVESDTAFNDVNVNWGTDSSQAKMDIQTVGTHELGHWLQLLDLYGSNDGNKMMYGYVSNGLIKRGLDISDIAGIQWIYGPGKPLPTGDILAYYRGTGLYTNTVETNDLLKAADDWRNNVIPQGFSAPITTVQLLSLADEWRISQIEKS